MPTVLAWPCGVTRSSRVLSRSVTSASPSGRNAIAHGTARFRARTDGLLTWAADWDAPPGAVPPLPGAGVGAGVGVGALAQAVHRRPVHSAITAMGRLTAAR